MTPTRLFIKPGFVGLLVIFMSVVLTMVFPRHAPTLPEGFFTPIIAFEFLESPAEARGMFLQADETGGQAVDAGLLAAFDMGNRLDYVYMVFYSGFLALFSLVCAKHTGKWYFFIAAALSLAVLVFDALENIQLLGITDYFRDSMKSGDLDQLLALLGVFTWLKWGGLVAVFWVLAPWFFKGGGFSKTVGFWGIFCGLLGVSAYFYRPVATELFCLSVAVMFLLMIVYCFRRDAACPM